MYFLEMYRYNNKIANAIYTSVRMQNVAFKMSTELFYNYKIHLNYSLKKKIIL